MDKKKLAALRAAFQNVRGGDIADPEFARVAKLQFKEDGRRKWPFVDPATFLGAPFAPDAFDNRFAGLDAALIGAPMDLGVTNRAGARLGPRAVRAIERMGPYDHVLRCAPLGEMNVADVGDIRMRSRYDLAQCHEDIEAYVRAVVDSGVTPLVVGGDHSISRPILRAIGRDRPVGMIHIDAHCDTSGEFEGSKFHHGGPFREAVLDGVLDPERTIQIGIRGGAEFLWEFSYRSGMTVIHGEEIPQLGVATIIKRARQVVGKGPVYVSFDIDALDPAFAPGTGTPEAGGLSSREALEILRGLAGLDIVGGDVVEVAPQYDSTTVTAQNAAAMLFTILCLVAQNPRRKAGKAKGAKA